MYSSIRLLAHISSLFLPYNRQAEVFCLKRNFNKDLTNERVKHNNPLGEERRRRHRHIGQWRKGRADAFPRGIPFVGYVTATIRYYRARNEWRECWKFGYNSISHSANRDYPKSDKTSGQIISEQIQNSKFTLTDLVAIRKFAEIAGIKFDEQKFRNRREFRMYVRELMKEED